MAAMAARKRKDSAAARAVQNKKSRYCADTERVAVELRDLQVLFSRRDSFCCAQSLPLLLLHRLFLFQFKLCMEVFIYFLLPSLLLLFLAMLQIYYSYFYHFFCMFSVGAMAFVALYRPLPFFEAAPLFIITSNCASTYLLTTFSLCLFVCLMHRACYLFLFLSLLFRSHFVCSALALKYVALCRFRFAFQAEPLFTLFYFCFKTWYFINYLIE